MSTIRIHHPTGVVKTNILLPGSKSETNRALMLHALSGFSLEIPNASYANDSLIMKRLLQSDELTADVHDAGTCMRFLLAYFCATNKHRILTGSSRMKERPVAPLVDALSELGFDIRYIEREGFLPLEIFPLRDLSKIDNEVYIDSSASSQFVSALMMIAPFLPNGLIIHLTTASASQPYIDMTANMLRAMNIAVAQQNADIAINRVDAGHCKPVQHIGCDWSAASYWYSIAFQAKESDILLESLDDNWLQGDRVVADWMKRFGIVTEFTENGARIVKKEVTYPKMMKLNFRENPDLAQTFAAMFAAQNIYCTFSGIDTLHNKETDRITALQAELNKINVRFDYSDMYEFYQLKGIFTPPTQTMQTYNDHRMAMSFAPLALICPIEIDNPEVVGKSYPGFWNDLSKAGFIIDSV